MSSEYTPGVCNIGPAEIRLRKLFGWTGLILSVLLWGGFIVYRIAPAWRLALFLPATLSALGFLQAGNHFCVKFALQGIFNFGPDVGRTNAVEQPQYRREDRKKSLQIIRMAVLVGAVVAAAAYFMPF